MTFDQAVRGDEKSMSRVIFAAGGLVWRQTPHGPEVAVIHRSRYGGDWCLPKGKLKQGESWEEAALREVKEEIGCEVRIASFAGSISYEVDGTPKIVLFWNMTPDGECFFQPSEEVCEVVWLTPREAIKSIDYVEEKNLLAKVYYGQKSFFVPRLGSRRKSRRLLPKSSSHRRLAASLEAYRVELECRIGRIQKKGQSDLSWADAARTLLCRVETALDENNVDEGWKCFHAAQRMEIFGLEEDDLETKAEALRREAAEKLSSWRKETVAALLKHECSQRSNVTKERVYQAALIRDEHSNNRYHQIGLLQGQMNVLSIILFFALGLTLLLAWYDLLPLGRDPVTSGWKMLVSVMLFGFLGGAVSAVLSLARTSTRSRIPEQIAHNLITLMRVFVGAAAALAVHVFLQADILNLRITSGAQILAISFAAGFSERLVVHAVESVTGKA